ncbi:major paralogous domain-containing protein [Fibrobacter sp. UWT3]|uniref:FISUMP domain-containing protein n=1 Tax=Fibrobacter sp. UWT3 TaxID=1896225 RepID=UPI000BD2C13A|nr:FISUMP domain-containing protein [Fibrobacter sp. UWT3]SOE75708.1 major paralogous domain-containing protein [Fibrobacter sp. UWT3]SOE75714.1 major paralogous domain-containing protein [Fibrobacter sp. UWT3]
MKRFINLICYIAITCFFLSCSDGISSGDNPFSTLESSSSENVFLSSSSEEGVSSSSVIGSSSSIKQHVESSSSDGIDCSSSSESITSSSSVIECSSSEKHQVESSSSDGIVDSSSSEPTTSSSSVIECSSSIKHQVESSSSNEIVDSSSSEPTTSSSLVIESSSSHTVVGKCKTSTEDKCIYGELYDERDGQTYKTVFMGTQEWMAENLNYSDSVASPNLQGGSWCYNNDDLNCDKYGRLYSWSAAMDIPKKSCSADTISCKAYHNHRGICPNGWHLPDTTSSSELINYIKKYSPTEYGYDVLATSETKGSNAFGYSILYTGFFYNSGDNPSFTGIGVFTKLWSSTAQASSLYTIAYTLSFHGLDVFFRTNGSQMTTGNPVRCIKDN